MNLFYEDFPEIVSVGGEPVRIITDFREYIRLLDMLKCRELTVTDKYSLVKEYFLEEVFVDSTAIKALEEFITMRVATSGERAGSDKAKKDLFSYSIDYPYILSGFLRDYGIDLNMVDYLHWWKFRALFAGLSEDTQIMKIMGYRAIEITGDMPKEQKRRYQRLKQMYALPDNRTEEEKERDFAAALLNL